MERLNSVRHFEALQGRLLGDRDLNAPTIVIPAGTCGRASGASELVEAAEKVLSTGEPSSKTRLRVTGCHGFCQMEPSVLVEPGRTFYPKVGPKDVARIIEAAARGEPVEELLFTDPETGEPISRQEDLPFYRKQVRTILSRNEKIGR